MMSGAVCCAEISRMFSDPVGNDRSRMDVWKRTSELSGRIESFSQNYRTNKKANYCMQDFRFRKFFIILHQERRNLMKTG